MQETSGLSAIASQPVRTADTPGTVRVYAVIRATVEEAWAALTQRELVGRWFGDLSESLQPGGAHRLDFGDGDSFEIFDVALDPPFRLFYRWRFLGTGPSDMIVWKIEPDRDGCRVCVTDSEPARSAEAVNELTEGWTDFLERLRGYFATGQSTRYEWRRDFDGSIEMDLEAPQAFQILFRAANRRNWLPWWGGAIASGSTVAMLDGARPTRFRIDRPASDDLLTVRIALSCPEWLGPTHCTIAVQRRGAAALLTVSHRGWEAISGDENQQMAQRRRFAALWVAALRRAERLAGRTRSR